MRCDRLRRFRWNLASEPKRITVASAEEALQELRGGNAEFISDDTAELRADLAENGQAPYAVVITCSDSRVAPEVLFNTTMGEIFTIRTAGNIVDEITPSVEEARKTETDESAIATLAEYLNIQNTIEKLRTSTILSQLESEGKIRIIGAKYNIVDGSVEFLE